MKKASLKVNYVYNFISQIITLVIPLITTPYLARILEEEGNGQYSYAVSIITYFILFANLGFNIYGQREISKHRGDKEEKSRIFFEILLLKFIFTIISLVILFTTLLSGGFGEKYSLIILVLSVQVVSCIFDIQFLYQGEENFRAIAIRTVIMKLISIVLIFCLIKSKNDVWIYALCTSLTLLLSNFIMWPQLGKYITKVKFSSLNIKRCIKPSIMIFLPTLAVTLYSVFDKTMIGLLSSNPDYDNGCYEQAYKINSVAVLLVTVISPILIPRNAYDYHSDNMESFNNHVKFSCNYVWILGVPMIAGFMVLSQNMSSWYLGNGYLEVPLLLCIMSVRLIFSGFSVIFGEQIFIAIGMEKYPTIASFAAAIVNITLNFFLIPLYGAVGAAITTAISEFLIFLVLLIFVSKKKFISINSFLVMGIKYVISAVVMFIVLFFIERFFPNAVWSFLILVVIGVVIYVSLLFILRDKFLLENFNKIIIFLKTRLIKRKI